MEQKLGVPKLGFLESKIGVVNIGFKEFQIASEVGNLCCAQFIHSEDKRQDVSSFDKNMLHNRTNKTVFVFDIPDVSVVELQVVFGNEPLFFFGKLVYLLKGSFFFRNHFFTRAGVCQCIWVLAFVSDTRVVGRAKLGAAANTKQYVLAQRFREVRMQLGGAPKPITGFVCDKTPVSGSVAIKTGASRL